MRHCPRVHLLATSREPLGIGGETIYRVPSLSLHGPGDPGFGTPGSSDAVALLAERARAQGITLPSTRRRGPLVVSVCQRLDGMPLAIELAAARLRSMSLAELHDRLDQRFRLLTGGSRTALERQQTLRATVGWSYSLLTAAERVLLGRLSVFAERLRPGRRRGGVRVRRHRRARRRRPARVAGGQEPGRGRAHRTGLRYRLLETIRLFAAERLAEAGDEEVAAVAAAHCAHFLARRRGGGCSPDRAGQGSWLARLDADQANMRRAAGHAAGGPDGTALVLQLGVALDRYWRARSRLQEAFGLLVPVLRRPDARADPALFAAALVTATWAACWIDIATARHLAEQAVQVARQLADDRLLIRSLAALCDAYFWAGEPDAGRPLGRRLSSGPADSATTSCWPGACSISSPSTRPAPGSCSPRRSPVPNDPATFCTNSSLHSNAGALPWTPGHPGRPGPPGSRGASRAADRTPGHHRDGDPWAWSCARRETSTAPVHARGRRAERPPHRDSEGIAARPPYMACVAGDAGDWERAAALHGAAQALQDRLNIPWEEFDARCRQDSLDQARAHLGDEQLERAYARGRALSPRRRSTWPCDDPVRPDRCRRRAPARRALAS